MLDSIQAMSLLTVMEIIGPVLLMAVLIYGTVQFAEGAGRRRRCARVPRVSFIARAPKQKSGKLGALRQELRRSFSAVWMIAAIRR